MSAKFHCLACNEKVKPGKVEKSLSVFSRSHHDALRFHDSHGQLCGPLVWDLPESDLRPTRDVVMGSTRRALIEQYGVDRAEILIRAIEVGWKA